MLRKIIETAEAPAAIGPYSQAVSVQMGDRKMVFCSGQIALDPVTGEMVKDDVELQARQVMENLAAVLRAAGGKFSDIAKTTVFLSTMTDFAAVNAIYCEYFPKDPPARETVAAAGLPRGARVEISAIAVI